MKVVFVIVNRVKIEELEKRNQIIFNNLIETFQKSLSTNVKLIFISPKFESKNLKNFFLLSVKDKWAQSYKTFRCFLGCLALSGINHIKDHQFVSVFFVYSGVNPIKN